MKTDIKKLKEKLLPLRNTLDEKQWRFLLGAEAKFLGHGGIRAVSQATGVEENTIRKGKRELESGNTDVTRIRKIGAGRKRLADTDKTILKDLEDLVEPTARGDPVSSLRWTIKSTYTLADKLKERGHTISHNKVKELLHEMEFSLQANKKTVEGKQHPDRDAQFNYINEKVDESHAKNQPVISVDTKKKEIIGNFKNSGTTWRPKGNPETVEVHDFTDKKAVPYGVYELLNNHGFVNVGVSGDTAEFAVESIRYWDKTYRERHYPNSNRLLITADAGGSNRANGRLWKYELQKLADERQIEIHVLHFPPGTSKWNKIEHRLFSFISKNWKAIPLRSYAVVINTISATKTKQGLTVDARLDKRTYKTGKKISDEEYASINLVRDEFHGDWNYTIKPHKKA